MAPESSGSLLIRADASRAIGVGHVMRCLALAQAWQDAGGTVAFVCAELPKTLVRRLIEERCTVHVLDAPPGSQRDVERTQTLAATLRPDWIVLDGYRFGPDFQAAFVDLQRHVLVVDDHCCHPTYHAQAILNQNLGASPAWYERIASNARLLLGCRYAMLRREFRSISQPAGDPPERARRILVTLGGADPANRTRSVVEACCQGALPGSEIHVLIGHANPLSAPRLEEAGRSSGLRVVVHRTPANLVELMAGSDLAISAAGSSIYELGYLGVPMILIVTADNQRPGAHELERLGGAIVLESGQLAADGVLAGTIDDFARDAARRKQCVDVLRGLIDGQGACRVVAALK